LHSVADEDAIVMEQNPVSIVIVTEVANEFTFSLFRVKPSLLYKAIRNRTEV